MHPVDIVAAAHAGLDRAVELFGNRLTHQLFARLAVEETDQILMFRPRCRTARIAPELGLEGRALFRMFDHVLAHDVGMRVAISHQAVDLAGEFGVVGAVAHIAVDVGIVFGDPRVERIGHFGGSKIAGPHGNEVDDVERSELGDLFAHDVGMDRQNTLLDEFELDADFFFELFAFRLDGFDQQRNCDDGDGVGLVVDFFQRRHRPFGR